MAFIPSSGQAFNHPENTISSSVSGSWTTIGNGGRSIGNNHQFYVDIQGIYWGSTTSGATLYIRDANGFEWYLYQADGSTPAIDLLQTPLTLLAPFEYFDSEGSNQIVMYGVYR